MKTKKPEKMYKTGSIFELVGSDDKYMFCQVARHKFALINMKSGNRYKEMKEYTKGCIDYPFSFIKKLVDENTKIKPID